MYRESLFLGFPLDSQMEKSLAQITPELRGLFLSGGDYLQEFEDNGKKFLGKIIPGITDLPSLDLIKSNVTSQKQRLFPDNENQETDIWLFAFVSDN